MDTAQAKTLLLVEDEPLTAKVETKQLEQYGYAVIHQNSGEKAVDFMGHSPGSIDLVLMDIDLGEGIDGTQAAQEILSYFDIPVVFLSSHTEPEIVERTEKITSYGYVVKNSGITVLDASIKMAFRLFEQKQMVKYHQEELAQANEEMEQTNEELRQTNEELEQSQNEILTREHALQLSETRYRELFDNMRNGVAVFEAVGEGEDFVFRDVNVATQKIENLSRDEMIGKSIVELFPKVKEFGLFSVLQRVWRTGRAELHPVSHYQDKRIVGWRENYVYKLPSGELVSVYEDVTERRQSLEQLERQKARLEEAQRQQNELLRDSQQKYSVLYNNAPLPYQSLDADGCFVDVNPAWLRTLGYQRDEVLGRCFVDFLHPDSRWVFEDSFPELKETGSTHNREYQILHKDGRYLTILLEGCVVYQKDGSFDRTYCVFQDLSERKRLEELVRQEKQRLGSILAAMDIGLIMHDAQYRVQWVNRKIREMFPQGDPVGKLCYDFFEGREAPCERCAVRQSFETGEIQTIESHNQANDRWYYSIAQPMREQDGAFNYVLESVMDITEFKQAEAELQQAYNDKQALLRELQHRAKNSFNVLYNMVYLKSLTSSSENERKTLDDISARIKSMAELYTLLYEAEAVESVPLDRYLAKVAESVVPMAHGCAIKTELEPVTLAARDAVNLGLVVTELVTNALKYAFPETGAGTVRLKLRRTDTGLLLIIADDGVGMSRDFDPSQSRSLGLDLVYKMVAGLQGRLELDSSQGTTWHLYIPLES